ncbi:MAG TPA: MBL fold metallo-hydrolase [Solirubrobacteraceae bacterium]|jgi:glyoxylase-like metal-dependent hydrolase (beta-lactamase superfamily II)
MLAGVDPKTVSLVLMTHLHVDHASAMSEFPQATFLCTDAEWQAATAPLGAWSGYVRRQLPDPSRVRTITFDTAHSESNPPFERESGVCPLQGLSSLGALAQSSATSSTDEHATYPPVDA